MPRDEIDEDRKTFRRELDEMIESTEEFIRDDQLTPYADPEKRFTDLLALLHVRQLHTDFYGDGDKSTPEDKAELRRVMDELGID